MKLLLVAINAKYIHSNLAVYSLKAYAEAYGRKKKISSMDGNPCGIADYSIRIAEFTINHSEEDILKGIYRANAELIAFSCYIWNIDMVLRLAAEIRKLLPEVFIWLGGPEVSYEPESCLDQNRAIDGIMMGEGEQTFLELSEHYMGYGKPLSEIDGLCFRERGREKMIHTPSRKPINLDLLPFPYDGLVQFANKIIYYESSRGCPYSCSYCLSSVDRRVRLRDTQLVKKELQVFLENKVAQVKFVDRTFNCNRKHAMEIWRYIKEQDNGITNFHFEISADLLEEEELALLAALRPGQVQFEIGVQSVNKDTIAAVHRKMNLDKLSYNVGRLKENANIHLHLDLIAGLPLEDYESFEISFQAVYNMKPDQLQMGFLKVLKGSLMKTDSKPYGIIYRDNAPYEVLYTDHLTYEEMLKLKGICDMVEVYYNSGQFSNTLLYLEHFYPSSMKLYEELNTYYEERELELRSHSRIKRYEIILGFFIEVVLHRHFKGSISEGEEQTKLFKEILLMDLFLREKLKSRPDFLPPQRTNGALRKLYDKYRREYQQIHIEQFSYDIGTSVRTGRAAAGEMIILFIYGSKDPINHSAAQIYQLKKPDEKEEPLG